jgi:hypothetical protein
MNKRGKAKTILLVLAILVIGFLVAAAFFTFVYADSCDDLGCFNAAQKKCARVTFSNVGEDATWDYRILGKSDNYCRVRVILSNVDGGSSNLIKYRGESMICELPFGKIISPEADISVCRGVLKEGLQEIIIRQLHAYIIGNIGDIGDDLRGEEEAVEVISNESVGNETG